VDVEVKETALLPAVLQPVKSDGSDETVGGV
jgi:hypothetical protein